MQQLAKKISGLADRQKSRLVGGKQAVFVNKSPSIEIQR